ncbi:MAG: prefoldin subunit beta [Candidatus Helarchaeota archaeon]
MEGLPPNVQHQIQQFQQIQQRYELLVQQRQQLELTARDVDMALEKLEKTADDMAVYKSIGAIMVQVKKDELIVELKDKKETYEMRLKTLEKQEERAKSQLDEMREKIQKILQSQGSGGAGSFQPM